MNLKKFFSSIPAITVLIIALIPTGLMAAQEESHREDAHGHEHDGASADIHLELNNGEKWATDAPLRKGMENIHGALATRLPEIHDNSLPADGYQGLAEDIQREVRYMISNCKLPPAADAQLHILLAALIQGSATMQSDQNPRQGAMRIVQALDTYGEYFAHPDWKSLPSETMGDEHTP